MSTDCDSMHDDASDVYNEETSGCDVFNEEISNFDDAYNEQSYIVLSQADIRRRIEDDITKLSSVLSVSIIEARILLRHYNWVVSQVHEEWFADEESVRKAVGLLEKPVADLSNATQVTCGVCFETFPKDDVYAAACGHPYCSLCWAGYISTAINDGPGCLNLRCPEPGCPAAVGHDMVDVLGGSEDDKARYFHYFLRSYVDQNKTIKWCPAPGCEYAVHFELGSGSYDVTCRCSHGFCWNCTEEAHRPVDCDTVSKWIIKNASDSENATWIMVFSKPCPKCKRPIEKNQGCNHMACAAPCGHRFCWHCLNDLTGHSQSRCNGYREVGEDRRKRAKMSLQRYSHYYGRWANNHSSRAKAIEELQKMQDVHLAILSDIQCVKGAQLEFIIKGWLQIVECRRVLKWTYAYGYYLQEGERAKISLFEYLQGQAEAGLERLHHCAETELQQFLKSEGPSEGFNEFRLKLINLTQVTGKYFENLVQALENGLLETDSKPVQEADHDEDLDSYWSCDRCTYINFGWAKTCEMCNASFI